MNASPRQRVTPLISYLRLFRLPNVFTAAADVTMGFLVVRGSFMPGEAFFCLVAASCLLYTAGMVLNDVFDVEQDARQRPERPLPAGEISVSWARWLGFELLVLGAALAWLAGYASLGDIALPWRSGAIGSVLALCIVAYDAGLKASPLGPALMGSCRGLNVLLGMSLAPVVNGPLLLCGFNWPQLVLAAGLGVYVAGVTWYARSEADESSGLQLFSAAALMVLGIGLFGTFPLFGKVADVDYTMTTGWWWLLVAVLGFTIARRSLTAAFNPSPVAVQMAVKQALVSIIFLNAAATLMVCGPYLALAVLLLLAPTLILGRWIYST